MGLRGPKKTYKLPDPWNYRYARAKAQAKFRRDYWAFTPETWFDMWVESGVMQHCTNKIHGYSMVRKDPIEAWSPNNCIIVPRRRIIQEHSFQKRRTQKEWSDEDAIKGWNNG